MTSSQLYLSQLVPYELLRKFGPDITKKIFLMVIQIECVGVVKRKLVEINDEQAVWAKGLKSLLLNKQ